MESMGTLASQAETGVWVQAPGMVCTSPGDYPEKIMKLYTQNPPI